MGFAELSRIGLAGFDRHRLSNIYIAAGMLRLHGIASTWCTRRNSITDETLLARSENGAEI